MLSPSVPEGPRNPNGYSAEEVLRAIRGLDGHRKVTFRYELLDGDLNFRRNLENVISGSVSQQYIAAIKRTASFEIRDDGDINFLHDHIKPYIRFWLPPLISPERRVPEWKWTNNFSTNASGDDVTVDNVSALGDGVTSVNGELVYVEDPRISSTASIRMGADGGASADLTSLPVNVESDIRRFRAYLFCEQGAGVQVSWFDETGTGYGTGSPGMADGGGFRINGDVSEVLLAGNDQGATVYNQLRDRWLRVEIDHDYDEMRVYYRLHWGNPYGSSPDLSFDAPLNDTNRVAQFQIQKLTDGGSFPDAKVYLGPVRFGNVTVIAPRPNPTDNDFVEFPLGVFLMSSPVRKVDDDDIVTRDIDAYDRVQILIDDKLTEPLTVHKGESYYDILNDLLSDYPRIIEPTNAVIGRTREYGVGKPVKEVIDALAEAINYHTIRVDEEGTFLLRGYVSPDDRTPEFHYADDEYSIMTPDVEEDFDIYEIHNVWIVSLSEADENPVHVQLENRDPANPFSIPRRGRKIVDFREQEEGYDPASLMRKAKRLQYEANREYENISFTTMINPLHSDNDCYTLEFTPLGINQKYTEINWEFNLTAEATMTHTCRRVVELDPEMFTGFIEDHLQINGSLNAGNIKWGQVQVTGSKANKPVEFVVTGLDLAGRGPVMSFVTGVSNHANLLSCSSIATADKIRVFATRVNSGAHTFVNWLAVRDV